MSLSGMTRMPKAIGIVVSATIRTHRSAIDRKAGGSWAVAESAGSAAVTTVVGKNAGIMMMRYAAAYQPTTASFVMSARSTTSIWPYTINEACHTKNGI